MSIAAAFSKAQVARLFKTGQGLSRKDLPKMDPISRNYLSGLTSREVDALYAFMLTLPEKGTQVPAAQPVAVNPGAAIP